MAQSLRTRRIVRWPELILCVVLGITFIASLAKSFSDVTPNAGPTWDWELANGALIILQNQTPTLGTHNTLHTRDIFLLPRYQTGLTAVGIKSIFVIPIWIPLLILALPTTILYWIERRRPPPNHCQKCGYNLTGNVSGKCPEFGTPI